MIEWVHGGDSVSVGENIRKIRKEKGLTQKQLFELSGISEVTIRKYESGRFNPKIPQVERLAVALDVHPSALLGADYWDSTMNVQQTANETATLDSIGSVYGEQAVSILTDFLSLNDTGRRKAAEYIADLTEQTKYTK